MMVKVRALRPGMTLRKDLVHDGRTLLKAGSLLSEAMISVLKIRGISNVNVLDTDMQDAPDADIYYKRVMNSSENSDYQQKKQVIEDLFASGDMDEQTLLLKHCIIRQLEEKRAES